MNGIDLVALGHADDAFDVKVGAERLAGRADAISLVRLEAVQREAVLVRVDRHGAQAELMGRAEDANGDLAAVGGHQLANASLRIRPGSLMRHQLHLWS